jgi:hypothetical protein
MNSPLDIDTTRLNFLNTYEALQEITYLQYNVGESVPSVGALNKEACALFFLQFGNDFVDLLPDEPCEAARKHFRKIAGKLWRSAASTKACLGWLEDKLQRYLDREEAALLTEADRLHRTQAWAYRY